MLDVLLDRVHLTLFRFDLVELTALKLLIENTSCLVVFQFDDQSVLGWIRPAQYPNLQKVSLAEGGAKLGPLIYKLAKLDNVHVNWYLWTTKMEARRLLRL